MLPQHVLFALVAAVSAVPLNINLGAYSPALVVGDGEISLGSGESASELMQTLASGAAAEGGQQQGQQEQQQEEEQQEGEGEQQEGEGEGNNEEQQAEETAAKRAPSPNLVRTVDHFGKRSPAEEHLAAVEEAMQWIKRDLPGFREALNYAERAMQNTPKIEMGSEGAGVGIVVSPGLNVPANSAANGQPAEGAERKAKRGEVVREESEAPKMTLVAITEV